MTPRLPTPEPTPDTPPAAATLKAPGTLVGPALVIDEFMTYGEIAELREYAEQHSGDFHPAKVGVSAGGRINHSRRKVCAEK